MTQFGPPALSGAVKLFRATLCACVPEYEALRTERQPWSRRFERGPESPAKVIGLAAVTIAHRWEQSPSNDSEAFPYVEELAKRLGLSDDFLFSDGVERLLHELAHLDLELIQLERNLVTGTTWYTMAELTHLEHVLKSSYAEHPFMADFAEQVSTLYRAMLKSPSAYADMNEARRRHWLPAE